MKTNEENTIIVKEAMLNIVQKLDALLKDESRDVETTKQDIAISTAMTGAGKTYLTAVALELKVNELHDKGIQC